MTRRTRSLDSPGFTLVEVVIVVGLIALLSAAVSAAIIVFIRNDDSVVDRLTNSRDLQNISSFLPGDVASSSTIEDGAVVPFSAAALTIADCYNTKVVGVPILRLGWDQRWVDGSASEFEVVYDYVAVDDEVIRHSCRDNVYSSLVVARHFDGAPTVNLPVSGPDLIGTVEIVLNYPDDARRITASSRNYVIGP